MENELHSRRNDLFQELKPCCVKLSQLALRDDSSTSGSRELRDATSHLLEILEKKCRTSRVFDDRLADYVFFPVSQVLRVCQKRPGYLAELATRCLRILLENGWKSIGVELGQQLLLLLTFFAEGGQASPAKSEELQVEAFAALAALFKDLHNTPKGPASLLETPSIPTLGQCLSVILDGVVDGASQKIQLEAIFAVESLWSCVKDQQALSNFLPGTISAITKCLTPGTSAPRSRKVLMKALDVFQKILTASLSDMATRNIQSGGTSRETGIQPGRLSKAWLTATAGQMKLAMTNIIKLRDHEYDGVRNALTKMCLIVLDECYESLADSRGLLVETVMILAGSVADGDMVQNMSLKDLAIMHSSLADLIRDTTYKWVANLPKVMLANDEPAKQSALQRLSNAQDLLSGLEIDSNILTNALVNSLRECVTGLLELDTSPKGVRDSQINDNKSLDLAQGCQTPSTTPYHPIIMPHSSQARTLEQFEGLIATIGSQGSQTSIATDLVDCVRNDSGYNQLSALWISFRLLQAAKSRTMDLDDFVDQALSVPDGQLSLTSELYRCSLSSLSSSDEEEEVLAASWQTKAVSLEVVSYVALTCGESFRPELVDTLYPIVHLLGSGNANLREHAIKCLDILSESCGYASTSEMIIGNVDYLVNAISLKLNTFEVSRQAPQVLVMMIRLSGPALLPYLDDVVGSIFAALDNFHGYSRLVESLFAVLGEIVEEGSKAGKLKIRGGPKAVHRKERPSGLKIEELVTQLTMVTNKRPDRDEVIDQDFPRQPWKDAATLLDEVEKQVEEPGESVIESGKAPQTKVYIMVQSITRLGQHYLTNESPLLRHRLLDLICSASMVLSTDEDHFLPLINEIWPVLVKRLYDEEPFVAIAAARTVSEICKHAGDFMATRIEVEWQDILKLARHSSAKAEAEKKGRHGRGVYSHNWQVWDGLVGLLLVIIEYVRINDEMFDEALEILAGLLESRPDVRNALSTINEDAVWLLEFRHGKYRDIKPPVSGVVHFANPDGDAKSIW